MSAVVFEGCATRPLASYLKSLGVIRLLASQRDPNLSARWENDRLSIETVLTNDDVLQFFSAAYHPTPIVAPWNGGSGFYPKDQKRGIETIAASTSKRMVAYREAIEVGFSILRGMKLDKNKEQLLLKLRNELSDEALQWLDAVVLMTPDRPRYPPLLGTGGNDGRLEFTNNFMQRIVELIDLENDRVTDEGMVYLRSALFGTAVPGLGRGAIGQFQPSAAGGVNASTGFLGADPMNPWDYVLMIEGALFFSAAATRRGESAAQSISYPFTFDSAGSGSGALSLSDDDTSRGEMWLPVWSSAPSYSELQQMFSEGRITVGTRVARDGVDVARALSTHGVQSGISSFERYTFAQRNGLAFLAMPQGRLQVRREPSADLLADLERRGWLQSVRGFSRRKEAPAALQQQVKRLEDAIFRQTRVGGPKAVQDLIAAIGALHRQIALSPKTRERLRPVHRLSAGWFDAADDGSDEVRLAGALATLGGNHWPIRNQFFPLDTRHQQRLEWDETSTEVVDAGGRLNDFLLKISLRRARHLATGEADEQIFLGSRGVPMETLSRFVAQKPVVETRRVFDLMAGLSLAEPPERSTSDSVAPDLPTPAAFLLLKLFFIEPSLTKRLSPEAAAAETPDRTAEHPLNLRRRIPQIVRLLSSSKIPEAINLAALFLRRAGGLPIPAQALSVPYAGASNQRDAARRLVTALLVPVDIAGERAIANVFRSREPNVYQ